MINVLTIDSEKESAERLGLKTLTYFGDKYVESFDNSVNVRWGNSRKILSRSGAEVDFKFVVNPAENIAFNCRKHEALKKLSLIVKTPTLYETEVPAGIVAVVRPIEHSGGSNFQVKTGPFTLNRGHEYATEFIRTSIEYRVWFINGKTLCARRARSADRSEYPCRSEWGYEFCEITKKLHNQTVLAARYIGLDCGAADILSKNGVYYFLELNSAPTLDLKCLDVFYKKNLKKLIQKKFPHITIESGLLL